MYRKGNASGTFGKTSFFMLHSSLPPEFIKARDYIDGVLYQTKKITLQPIPKDFCQTNQVIMTPGTIRGKNLPAGETWTWNQSKGKKTVVLEKCNAVATLRKLISRRRKQTCTCLSSHPHFKVWHFEITPQNHTQHFNVLWCELGKDENTLRLEDFSFLAEFTSPEVSQELWPAKRTHFCVHVK